MSTWAHWRVKSPVPTLFIICSGLYQWKHQVSMLLILLEGTPRVPRGFTSQRASNIGNVSVLWYYNGADHITSPGIVGIGQRQVCVLFNWSSIVAPTCYAFYWVAYYSNIIRAHWRVKSPVPNVSLIIYSEIFQRKHQVIVLLKI